MNKEIKLLNDRNIQLMDEIQATKKQSDLKISELIIQQKSKIEEVKASMTN